MMKVKQISLNQLKSKEITNNNLDSFKEKHLLCLDERFVRVNSKPCSQTPFGNKAKTALQRTFPNGIWERAGNT